MSIGVQARINALVRELRSWASGENRYSLNELADLFDLDVFIVSRVANSEGIKLVIETGNGRVDPNASTIDLDPKAVKEALNKPDPNPEWADKDKDTGVWKKKPSGEWERTDEE
jgi:hypothetical protein